MSTLKGISPVRFHLVINALTAYMSLLQGGYDLEDVDLQWVYPHVTVAHALFRSTDEDVDLAGRVLRATIDRLQLRTISRSELLVLLQDHLAEMRVIMKRVDLGVDPF